MAKEKESTEDIKEVKENKHWQWIKGENTGNVVTIKDTDDLYINFNEGGRLAKDLKDEFIQPLEEDLAKELFKTQKPNSLEKPSPSANIQNVTGDISIPALNIPPSPIRVLFDKQKKNNKVKLLLEFPVNIPGKGVYELMSTSFDPTEVNEQLQSFILDQLSEDEILNCLHNSVQSLIESKYKGE